MEQRLTQLAARLSGMRPQDVRVSPPPPLAIQSNRLYDIHIGDRHWIAKEFLKPDELHDCPPREYDALALVAGLDIAPQPVHIEPYAGDDHPLVLYEFMPGAMWDRYTPTPAELAQLADLWLTKHTVTRPDLWPARGYEQGLDGLNERIESDLRLYEDWANAHFPAGLDSARRFRAVLDGGQSIVDQLRALPHVARFCRSDARFANVIRRPDGRLGLVDWEDSGLRDPASDLADLITHPNQEDLLGPDEWQPFLTPYLAALTPADSTLAERLHLLLLIYPLFWLPALLAYGVRRAEAGQIAGWRINDLPANQRLRRYLARAEAGPSGTFADALANVADVRFFPT